VAEFDLAGYEGREQALVKHTLLKEYLRTLVFKVQRLSKSFVFIDGFAGPWCTSKPNFEDSSFGVATASLRQLQQDVMKLKKARYPMHLVFVDSVRRNFEKLQEFAKIQTAPDFQITPLYGRLADLVPSILTALEGDKSLTDSFWFVFLDPKGWAQIPMLKIRPLIQGRKREVLINLMTSFISRFVGEDDRAESFVRLFGRSEALTQLADPAVDREDVAVREYAKSLMDICGFKFSASAAILEPEMEAVRYYLVYGTNHVKGIEVFKASEMKSMTCQNSARHQLQVQKVGFEIYDMFEGWQQKTAIVHEKTRRNRCAARRDMLSLLLTRRSIEYDALYCGVMAFPFVVPDDLKGWLREVKAHVDVRYGGDHPERRRSLQPGKGDTLTVIQPAPIEAMLSREHAV
jgi:three-Cys-motif partner protein